MSAFLLCCMMPIYAQRSSAAKSINNLAAPVPTPLLNSGFSESVQLLVADVQALITPGATSQATIKAGKTRLSDQTQ